MEPLLEIKVAKVFYLVRNEDESGISGTGRVAQGFQSDTGKVAVFWLGEHPSVVIYDNIGEVRAIHGHGGKTDLVFEPDYKRAYGEIANVIDNISLSDIAREKLPDDGEASKLLFEKPKGKN